MGRRNNPILELANRTSVATASSCLEALGNLITHTQWSEHITLISAYPRQCRALPCSSL